MVRVIPISGGDANQEKRQDNQQPTQPLQPPSPPVPDQPPAYSKRGHACCKKSTGLERARFVVELITLVVLFYYVRATYRQVRAMQEANRIAGDALALSERPWVGISSVQPVGFAVGGDAGVQLYFFNSGRTPALRGEHETYIDLTQEQPIGPPETTTERPTKGTLVLFPQQPAQHVGVTRHNALTPQQFSDVKNGKLWLRFWGTVTYSDREGYSHHAWFCGYVDSTGPGEKPQTCPHGNDAD